MYVCVSGVRVYFCEGGGLVMGWSSASRSSAGCLIIVLAIELRLELWHVRDDDLTSFKWCTWRFLERVAFPLITFSLRLTVDTVLLRNKMSATIWTWERQNFVVNVTIIMYPRTCSWNVFLPVTRPCKIGIGQEIRNFSEWVCSLYWSETEDKMFNVRYSCFFVIYK